MSNWPFLAYLDPGTGSMVLQMIVGGVLGGLLAIKIFWKRIVGVFTGKKPGSDTDAGPASPSAPDAEATKKP